MGRFGFRYKSNLPIIPYDLQVNNHARQVAYRNTVSACVCRGQWITVTGAADGLTFWFYVLGILVCTVVGLIGILETLDEDKATLGVKGHPI